MSITLKKFLQISSVSLFFIIIVVFAFFRSYNIVFGLKIRDVNIVDGSRALDDTLHITGNAKNAVNLAINGRTISINHAGDFNETIALLSGYNIINITAKDKFGYVDEKNYKLMY